MRLILLDETMAPILLHNPTAPTWWMVLPDASTTIDDDSGGRKEASIGLLQGFISACSSCLLYLERVYSNLI